MFPDTATVTETGPGGQQQAGWGAVLADGTLVRVLLTAKVQTTKTPVLDLGQVIHVDRSPWDAGRCSVDPADFEFVSPSDLARRIASLAEPSAAPDPAT
jgi:hypothetical protein